MYKDRLAVRQQLRLARIFLFGSAWPRWQRQRPQQLQVRQSPYLNGTGLSVGFVVHRCICTDHTIERRHWYEAVRPNQFTFNGWIDGTAVSDHLSPFGEL